MSATAQLAFLLEPRRDDLTPAEQAAVDARVEADDLERGRHAWPAPSCSCSRPCVDGDTCLWCGRSVEAPAS